MSLINIDGLLPYDSHATGPHLGSRLLAFKQCTIIILSHRSYYSNLLFYSFPFNLLTFLIKMYSLNRNIKMLDNSIFLVKNSKITLRSENCQGKLYIMNKAFWYLLKLDHVPIIEIETFQVLSTHPKPWACIETSEPAS